MSTLDIVEGFSNALALCFDDLFRALAILHPLDKFRQC